MRHISVIQRLENSSFATRRTVYFLPVGPERFPYIPTELTIYLGFTNSSSYWADEVLLSTPAEGSSPKYLLAATRSRKTGVPGYVSAFSLDARSGAIKEQLFLQETTNSGGSANAVSPASFSEDFFAITDSGSNFIEVWKIKNKSASAVAHLDLENGPANAVWYS